MLKQYCSLLFLLLLPSLFSAQTATLNPELSALIEKTISNYPKIKEALYGSQAAIQRTGIQRAGYLPTVSANASYNYVDPIAEATFGTSTFRFQPHNNYNVNLQANGLIYDFGRTRAAVNKAVSEFELGKANLEALKEALAFQVAQLYYGMVFTQNNLKVLQEQIRSLEANKTLLASKQRNGDALELDVLNAEVALANAQSRSIDLMAQLEKQAALMESFTGEANNPVTQTGFDFQAVSQDLTMDKNADFKVANARVELARKDSIYFRSLLRPALTYNSSLGFRNGYQPEIGDMRFNWGLGAGVSYPLYVGGKDRKQLRIAQINLAAARTAVEASRRNAQLELKQAQAEQRSALLKLKTAEKVVTQAQEALKIAQTRFTNGVATNVDVLTAQANLEQAQLTTLSASYQLCLSGLQIEKVAGRLK